jgi:hypothetical protein
MPQSPERDRLMEQATGKANWKRWGPSLSERAWGTVREDYSANGDAWNNFPPRPRPQPRLPTGLNLTALGESIKLLSAMRFGFGEYLEKPAAK